ncbi:MAG: cell division protein FtsQ/DivIB [Bacillota bacterium]|jgi:cell division protein FtsQ
MARMDANQKRAARKEKRRVQQRKQEKYVSPAAFAVRVGVILALFLIVYTVLSHSAFKVEEFQIEGNRIVSDDDIIALSGISVGDDIFQTNVAASADQIALHVMIDDVSVRVRPFHKILIEVSEKDAAAQFAVDETYYFINDKKIVVGESDEPDESLPVFALDGVTQYLSLGLPLEDSRLDTDLAIAAAAGDLFKGHEFVIAAGDESENSVFLDGVEVRLGTDSRLESKMEAAAKLMGSMSTQKLQSLEYIDISIPDEPVLKERPVAGAETEEETDEAEAETTSAAQKKTEKVKNQRDTSEAE